MATKAKAPASPQAELDVVRLRKSVATEEGVLPAGSIGTVVYVHRLGEAFEIEFDAPVKVVATLSRTQVELVSV